MSQVFAFNSRQIRTLSENNEIWFAAADVCKALNISWRGNTLACIPSAWKGMRSFRTLSSGTRGGGNQKLTVISEPAVYKLAFRSNKPEADVFTNWVASEVLPAIRKSGEYKAAPRQKALPMTEPHYPEMSADRKEALTRIETLRREATTGFTIVRNHVRICLHPGAYSMNMSLTEKEAYRILERFYMAADESLAAAYNAIEAGYMFGRMFGRD